MDKGIKIPIIKFDRIVQGTLTMNHLHVLTTTKINIRLD